MANKKKQTDEKAFYTFRFTHSEASFTALAHMQYDLFCRRNYIARMLIAAAAVLLGARNIDKWYSFLLIAYGGYLMTGKYISSNHTVRKLIKGLKDANLPFPSSKYIFESDRMRVISIPDEEELSPLYYSSVEKLGKDFEYFYLFRNQSGGYMIPREKLGQDEESFVSFIEGKTGKTFLSKRSSPIKRLSARIREKKREPDHL